MLRLKLDYLLLKKTVNKYIIFLLFLLWIIFQKWCQLLLKAFFNLFILIIFFSYSFVRYQLGLHDKPIGLLNVANYWGSFLEWVCWRVSSHTDIQKSYLELTSDISGQFCLICSNTLHCFISKLEIVRRKENKSTSSLLLLLSPLNHRDKIL